MDSDERKRERRRNLGDFCKGFFTTLVLIIPVFLIAYNTLNARNAENSGAVEQTSEAAEGVPVVSATSYNLLFVSAESKTNNILSVSLLRFDVQNYRIVVCDLPSKTVLLSMQSPFGLNEIYAQRGVAGISSAVQETLQIPISGYVLVHSDELTEMVDSLGEFTYNLDKPLEVVENGLTVYSKPAGTSRFTGNDVVKLLIYGQYTGDKLQEMHEDLWEAAFSAWTQGDFAGKITSLYAGFVDRVETGIGLLDAGSLSKAAGAVCGANGAQVTKVRVRGSFLLERYELAEGADEFLWLYYDKVV